MLKILRISIMYVLILFVLCSTYLYSDEWEYVYRDKENKNINCYLKYIPNVENIKGIIVRDYSKLPDITKSSFANLHNLAADKGYMTLYTVTSEYFPELYYDDSGPEMLDEIINEVVTEYNIPKDKIFIGGLSASGTRALRFTLYCNQNKSKYGTNIQGVFSVDSPLDMERFYYSSLSNKKYFKKGMSWEADLILKCFPEKTGTTPEKNPDVYRKSSVYSYLDPDGGNARWYSNTNIILFHEPDIEWWINERGAHYYDINSFDIAGFVTYLRNLGNKNVTLITTKDKGLDHNGEHKCHSWTIVDEQLLMDWIIEHS